MNLASLAQTPLFQGMETEEITGMLHCLGAYEKRYKKGEPIYRAGECVEALGLVLSGSAMVEADDLWGDTTILSHVEAGQLFAETYACIPNEPMMVNVIACEPSEILFLNAAKLLTPCGNACAHHSRLIRSLLQITAQKNLALSRRSLHTSPKTIRGRVLSYLSQQAKQNGGYQFAIPFNRQQLADYLSVDRSALSNELSKLKRDGLLTYEKNRFTLLKDE